MLRTGFLALNIGGRALYEHGDGTVVSGFVPGSCTRLQLGFTHIGIVLDGTISLRNRHRLRDLQGGDYFSVIGPARIASKGTGLIISSPGYTGINMCGGPIEEHGRLRYVNGCTDTVLVPPVRKGDPCLNHLHFPQSTVQTPHTHPSVRVNAIYRGSGICVLPEEGRRVSMVPGYAFVMLPETVHSFDTEGDIMDIITYHPDSDTGMTDDDHPMVNRTMVDGVSANSIDSIRTPV